jgi:hypothetical protein
LLIQNKVPKQKDTLRLWLSASLRDLSSKASPELARSFNRAQTVLDENILLDYVARHSARGWKTTKHRIRMGLTFKSPLPHLRLEQTQG